MSHSLLKCPYIYKVMYTYTNTHKCVLTFQVPYLGMRRRDEKGKLGPYTWMTYAQVMRSKIRCMQR